MLPLGHLMRELKVPYRKRVVESEGDGGGFRGMGA